MEKSRRHWWGQQLNLAFIPWSILLVLEGRRRKIHYLWAFLVVAQLISLSFAQNHFYVVILLTPIPLPPRVEQLTKQQGLAQEYADITMQADLIYRYHALTVFRISRLKELLVPVKSNNWFPHPRFYLASSLATFVALFLVPFAFNTPSFMTTIFASKGLPFIPPIFPYILLRRWGTVYGHDSKAYRAYTYVFSVSAILSVILYGKPSSPW